MEEAHTREIEVHYDLKKAMETLLGEREAEIEESKGVIDELKVSSARGRPVVDTSDKGGAEATTERSVRDAGLRESETETRLDSDRSGERPTARAGSGEFTTEPAAGTEAALGTGVSTGS